MEELRVFTDEELLEIIDKHEKWLKGEEGGEQADLSYAHIWNSKQQDVSYESHGLLRDVKPSLLSGSKLRGADLSNSNIVAEALVDVDLSFCDMTNVIFLTDYIIGINFTATTLRDALFSHYLKAMVECDFRYTDLSKSRFNECLSNHIRHFDTAIIDGISGLNDICPKTGSFIGYKKSREGYIVELEIPDGAKRSSAFGRKCRCSKAKVLSITSIDGKEHYQEAQSFIGCRECNMSEILYKVGQIVEPDWYNDCFWEECSHGIHFFLTRAEAVEYMM